MAYRYIMLAGPQGSFQERGPHEARHQLRSLGLRERWRTTECVLYASDQTPVVPLHGEGFIIGHMFSRQGDLLAQTEQFPFLPSADRLRRHVLENCWGAYLLVQADHVHESGFEVTRDPEGGMPCLHHFADDIGFIVSDVELAVLIGQYRKRIDWDSILHRLVYPDIKTARTGLDGIQELLPGMQLAVCGTYTSSHAAWHPWDFVAAPSPAPDEAAAAIHDTIDMVVKAWATTDRYILLELSGGLDSSIVGVCLKGSGADVTCCTLVTPVPGADERHYASQIATLLEAPLDTALLPLQPGGHDFEPLSEIAMPRVGMLQHATDSLMWEALQRHGASSFFSGGGGDTVFCYLTTAAPAADAFHRRGLAAGIRSVHDLAELHQCTLWRAAKLTLQKLLRSPRSPYKAVPDFLHPRHATCPPQHHPWLNAAADALPGDRERIFALATTQVYRDSAPRGLRAHLRLPLLSQPVVEAALRVPSWMWISGGHNRVVARQAFADALPSDVLSRRSKGSFTGYVGALYTRHRHQLRAYLLGGHLRAQGLLDEKALQQFLERELAPRDRGLGRVLDLCMVENWVRLQG